MNWLVPQDVLAWLAAPDQHGYDGCLCGDCAPKDAAIYFVNALADMDRVNCAKYGIPVENCGCHECTTAQIARILKRALEIQDDFGPVELP